MFKAVERVRKDFYAKDPQKERLTPEEHVQAKKTFEDALGGIKLDDTTFSLLERSRFNWTIAWSINRLLNLLKDRYVISEKVVLETDIDRGVVIRNLDARKDIEFTDFGKILDLQEAKRIVLRGTPKIYHEYSSDDRKWIANLGAQLLTPNLSFNKDETHRRKAQAVADIRPVVIKLKKNEVVIRKGEMVQRRHVIVMRGIKKEISEQKPGVVVLFSALFFFLLFFILGNFALASYPQFKLSFKDLVSISILLLVILFFSRFYFFLAGALTEKITWLPPAMFMYLIPVAGFSMMVRFLVGMEMAWIFSLVLAIALGLLLEKNFIYVIYAYLSSLVGIHFVASCRRMNDIYYSGFKTALVNMILAFSAIVLSTIGTSQAIEAIGLEFICGLGSAFFSGIFSALVMVALIPLFEYLFKYTTELKLFELSNLNHPILRDLMLRAPGSYHHSIMVGTLAEGAAEAIGANALLARVGGYYHDIGKIKNPHYYIENQFGGINVHDRQPAHMSKTMIMSHVKEGAKLGDEYQLGKPIVDIIEQHLGTSLMVYFYEKAKEEYKSRSETELLPPVQEMDFRYAGPKPQTRESALVMLADSVEASTRALATSNMSRVRVACEKIVQRHFVDGQLDDCDLTLKDLNRIVDSFFHVLVGVYHRRVGYPGEGIRPETYAKEDQDSSVKNTTLDEATLFKKLGH